ncbi:WD40-repeat-containing domain protein [Globomyces pollinis-pini]|nr:WD40-repeat-containing domain protein [Globomyces pollinis-pini]
MRPVTTHYEPNHINYILPVMTNPYNLAENSTKSPHWGQELTYNEDYLHIVQPDVLVLFEVLDFLTTSSKLMQHKDGWHKVAWGFLKLIGTNGQPNTEQDVRLQLYKYPWKLFQPKSDEKTPYVYQCWKQKTLKKYPSTLYVNVYAHTPLSERRIVGRAKTALEIETGKYTLDELMDMYGSKETNLVGGMAKSMLSLHCLKNQWRRKENEPCLIPNKLAYRIHSGSKGSFSCEFSSKGYLLAVASAEIDSHPIKIYEADSGERVATLEGHQDLVYQLKWSEEDSELLSASADCTVRVWGFLDDGTVKHTGLLSHPTFVYTAAFHPELNEPKIIATGAFDGIVRLWTHYRGVTQQNRKPYAKLRSHDSNVNSICFNQDGTQLFSGDGKGIIKIWNAIDFNAGSEVITFELSKTIDSLMGDPIQTLKMHPSNRKMLVQTLGPMAHMLDTRIHRFITHFVSPTSPFIASNSSYPHPFGARKNLPSISEQRHASSFRFIKSTFSPCGSYLFVGSNMCTVDIWRAESGTYVGAFNNTVLKSWKEGNCPVVHISFHPHDHIIAFSIWGEGEPVRVYKWHVEGQEIKMDERNHYQSKESIRMSQHLDVERIVARSLAGGLDKIGETEDNSVLKRKLKLSRNNSNAVPNGVAGECA